MSSCLSQETKALLERYFYACCNLYGIIPLSEILEIYNSQNEPITEEEFLSFVDEIDFDEKQYIVAGEDEFYDDADEVAPLDRDLIAEYFYIDGEYSDYYDVKEEQYGKPYYVPSKEKLLKYEDDCYHEKTLSFIGLRAFFRNQPYLTKAKADEIAEDVCCSANVFDTQIDKLVSFLSMLGVKFNKTTVMEFVSLYYEMYNDSRLHKNRGFTPNEISRADFL